MARLIVYYAHPGHKHSQANRAMHARARQLSGITVVDLYAEYPRYEIDIDREQQRLLDHDVVLMQFPLFWYSTPSLLKEWIDLVLEHGFAYGSDGDKLSGKRLMLAVTAAGPESAYREDGYQRYPIRTFLTPLERTAGLCHTDFLPPYVLYGSLIAQDDGRLQTHVDRYIELLEALRDDRYDYAAAATMDVVTADTLPLREN
ncbi:MAG: NAD(P)H-dependent oxidoreductase [Pseudomonadota bacterium]